MSVDRSAALLYAVVVCVTIGRSSNNENTMDDDAKEHTLRGDVSARSSAVRQRPRSASIGHLSSLSTPLYVSETPDDRQHRYHVASFDFRYVSAPFIVSLWIVLSTVAKIGQLTSGCLANNDEWKLLLYRRTW